MTDQGPAMRRFAATLADLYRSAGNPAYLKLIDHGQAQMPPVKFDDSTLSDWLNGRSVPASPKKFQVLVEGLLVLTADQHRRQVPPKRPQTAGLTRHNVRRLENLRAEAQRERRASQGVSAHEIPQV